MDATLLAQKRIKDPAYFTFIPNVPVFAEHKIVQRDKKTGKVIREVKVDEKKLREIAANNNDRVEKTGDLAPICIGHTRKDDQGRPLPPEQQPPIVAYAKDFRFGEFGKGKVPCIYANFYVRKGKEELLNDYPRRSPEFWNGEDFFDPIALLGAQTPQLDLGLLFYCREADGHIYARTFDMPDIEATAVETGKPDTAAGLGALGNAEDADQEEQYMKHCYSHPYAKTFHTNKATKYGMPVDGTGAGAADSPPPPPDDAGGMGGGMPYAKAPSNGRSAVADVQYARVMSTVESLVKTVNELKAKDKDKDAQLLQYARKATEADIGRRLEGVAREGFEFDPKIEFTRMESMDEAGREAHIAYMRNTYRNREEPTGVFAVPTSREPLTSNGRQNDGWEPVDGVIGDKHAEAALQYQKTTEGRTKTWDECVKVVAEKRKAGAK